MTMHLKHGNIIRILGFTWQCQQRGCSRSTRSGIAELQAMLDVYDLSWLQAGVPTISDPVPNEVGELFWWFFVFSNKYIIYHPIHWSRKTLIIKLLLYIYLKVVSLKIRQNMKYSHICHFSYFDNYLGTLLDDNSV